MMKSSIVVAALLASAGTGHGGDALRIAVSPAMSFAPTTLNIQARLVPSADNRGIELVAECADFYRSSEIPLEGENAPTTIADNSAACRAASTRLRHPERLARQPAGGCRAAGQSGGR